MGVDYTARAAYGRPVKFDVERDRGEVEEGLPDGYELVEFGSAYSAPESDWGRAGGDRYYILANSATTARHAPRLLKIPEKFGLGDEQIREMGLEPTGEVGWYVGPCVW